MGRNDPVNPFQGFHDDVRFFLEDGPSHLGRIEQYGEESQRLVLLLHMDLVHVLYWYLRQHTRPKCIRRIGINAKLFRLVAMGEGCLLC